jgi:tetratricopeptide (TPR) repeat protein
VDDRRADDEAHKLFGAFLRGIEDLYASHRTIEMTARDEPIAKRIDMNQRVQIGFALVCFSLLYALLAVAQDSPSQSSKQAKPPASAQQAPAQKPGSSANPFPEDTSNIPVVPTNGEPAAVPLPPAASNADSLTTSLLREDTDPIKSPDDPMSGSADSGGGFSSSSQGGDEVNIPAEPERPSRRQRMPEPTRQESAKDDENIGAYYLDKKNWKAALSRFESALVLDPENPDVYWGLAEAQRQLGDYSNAKANYEKVMVYDPDSKHSKEAKKYLKMPEIANAPAPAANQPANRHM